MESGVIDRDFVLSIFSNNKWTGLQKFIEYNNENYKINKLQEKEYEFSNEFTDEELTEIIIEKLNINNIKEIKNYNKAIRDSMIREIFRIKGMNISQVANVIGVTRKMIQRARKYE